ncbi:hypothetical protein [Syntrophomonas erecta]
MKARNLVAYASLGLLIIGIIVVGAFSLEYLREYQSTHYQGSYRYLALLIILPLLIGALLGGEACLTRSKRSGVWLINWYKLLFIGGPPLVLIVVSLLHLSGICSLPGKWARAIWGHNFFIIINAFVMGYAITGSWHKRDKDNIYVNSWNDVHYSGSLNSFK